MPPKRTKRSGLSVLKAAAAYKVLQNLKTILVTYPDDDDPEAGKEEDPQKAAEAAAELQEMNDLVSRLETIFASASSKCEAAARLWIDTVFFRASSLIPSSDALVLHLEGGVPSMRRSRSAITVSGVIGYIAIAVPKSELGLFTAEAKQAGGPLEAHLPQALAKQYACAIQLKKKILRGVLTDGEHWIFTVVTCKDSDTRGATFRRSFKLKTNFVTAVTGGPRTVYRDTIDLIPAILADFIIHSSKDIQPDEYFVSEST
ncbi:hypothetical protein B0H13DRAFT_2260684 [Mycena leptocephala]|nr:hypothetical protein B0H13DRAFT_2260684 [Mycena leptocephala]